MFDSEHAGRGGDQQNGEDYLILTRARYNSLIVGGDPWACARE